MEIKAWVHRLQNPRANTDLVKYLPSNVGFVTGTEGLEKHLKDAFEGRCRLFLECPDAVEGIEFSKSFFAEELKVRTVVMDNWFGDILKPLSILIQHNCQIREVLTPVKAHLAAARVAGYRNACYGIDDVKCYPILFQHPQCENILIATTPISSFIQSRFLPVPDWEVIIGKIVGFLYGSDYPLNVVYVPDVRPSYGKNDKLEPWAEKNAFDRSYEWFAREMFFTLNSDVSGVFEGYSSVMDVTGRQRPMPFLRGDCMGECTAIGALTTAINGEESGRYMTMKLLHTLFDTNQLQDCDPKSNTFGSLFFYNSPAAGSKSVYGDDNSRSCLGALLAEELLADSQYAEQILTVAYSLLRTTGPNGLREPSLGPSQFDEVKDWKYYRNNNFTEIWPHYQAWHWAFNIQMYHLSGDRRFMDSALSAMKLAIEAFPNYHWQNGTTGDWGRVLLPYAMLVEVDDTPEHRQWLDKVASFAVDHLNEYHALQELMGDISMGHYPSPRCNAEHGTNEAALVQNDGDPTCDLLYTMSYAFAGMNEAAMASGNPRYAAAAAGMADFMCRIQVKSDAQHYLDGAWMRAFDFELWDYFGNASDLGWGPWCVETGWVNSWISTTLGLRQLKRPLLCSSQKDVYHKLAPSVAAKMEI